MVEPTTLGIGVLAAYLGKDGLEKLLGPTADYLGGELQEFTKKRINNVGKIFHRAKEKLGDKINEAGSVSPKVIKTIINEGSYSDDEIAIEYFGGILASSRSDNARDDRGARIAKALDNLSCYQLRSHYLIYSTISTLFKGSGNSFNLNTDRAKLKIFMPYFEFVKAMEFTNEEVNNPQMFIHILQGLASDGLIDDNWIVGDANNIKKQFSINSVSEHGIVCIPTLKGAELFMWGFGLGSKDIDYIFSNEFDSTIDGISSLVAGSIHPQ
jgi:hypothetical protein